VETIEAPSSIYKKEEEEEEEQKPLPLCPRVTVESFALRLAKLWIPHSVPILFPFNRFGFGFRHMI